MLDKLKSFDHKLLQISLTINDNGKYVFTISSY